MTDKKEKKISLAAIYSARTLFLFAAFFLYIWLIVDPKLIFHGGGTITNYPVFFKGIDFFVTFLSRPGGPAEYLTALLSQALFYPALGAAALTAVAAGICFALRYIIKKCNLKTAGCFWLLPMVLLAAIYGQYSFNFLTTIALLISLAFLCIYLKIQTKIKAGRLFIFSALAIIAYLIAGGAFWLFAVSAILYDLFFTKHKNLAIAQLLLSVFIPYTIGFTLIAQTMIDAYTSLLPFSWKIIIHEDARATAWLMYSIYLSTPIAIAAIGIAKLKPNIAIVRPVAGIINPKSYLVGLIIFLIAATAIGISFQRNKKLLFQCDYYSYYHQWDKVVTVAKKNLNSLILGSTATRALYHQDQLFDKMLDFYQFPTVLFMRTKGKEKLFWKQADIYFDLGFVNMADHKWTCCLDAFGERPMILKRLAWINLVKDNNTAALIYLNSLKRTFFFNDFADKYLDLLNKDPKLLTDVKIQSFRKQMLRKDYSRDFFVPEIGVYNLFQVSSENRMAYEYMMTWLLLTKQLDKFAQNINYLASFGYDKLPQCFEEAALIYQGKTRRKIPLKQPLQISPQAQQRYAEFSSVCSGNHLNQMQLLNQLKAKFGNSYLFYYLFSRSGMKDDKVD